MIKISIIVPIYNVEKYLNKCFESLISQTLKDIEIIAINDGSTDSSYEIAKEYAKKHKNILLFNNENHGLSYTRNYGLKKAKGKYIMFVDSDDFLDQDCCEKLYTFAENKKADIVCFDLKFIFNNRESIMQSGTNELISPTEYILGPGSAACKFYLKSFMKKIDFKFKEGIWSEDVAIIPSLCLHTTKIYYLKDCFYNYFQRDNSITNQKKYNKKSFDVFNSINLLTDIFKTNGRYLEFKEEIEYIYITNLLLNIPLKVYQFKEAKTKLKELSQFMKKEYPKWYKNSHFKKLSFKQKIYCFLFYLNLPSIVHLLYKLKHIL